MTVLLGMFKSPVWAGPDANGPAGFTTQWHGHGDGHQDGNDPGDTAADRHNFGNAKAGRSDQNPTAGSAQDDFSEETGLPMVHRHDMSDAEDDEEDGLDGMLDMLM